MAPKKTSTAASKAKSAKATSAKEQKAPQNGRGKRRVSSKYFEDQDENQDHSEEENDTTTGSKRKRTTKAQPRAKKAAKVEEKQPDKPDPNPTEFQILTFMLSPSALEICRPSDEARELTKSPKDADYRTYSTSTFTPFEELMSAVILSRPISHSLGHRTIRTVLNPPYSFNTPGAIRKAGKERVHKSMFDARTQHKEKTAIEIVRLAEVVSEKFGGDDDTSLDVVRKECGDDINKIHQLLKSSIHGLGNTGMNIFFRRVQWLWTQNFPFMDERTSDAAAALGLSEDAEELYDSIDAIWEDLDTEHFDGKDEDEKKRRAFVVLLERIISTHLEKKVKKVWEEAEKL